MKNIAEFKDAPELAEKLLEVFSNLKVTHVVLTL